MSTGSLAGCTSSTSPSRSRAETSRLEPLASNGLEGSGQTVGAPLTLTTSASRGRRERRERQVEGTKSVILVEDECGWSVEVDGYTALVSYVCEGKWIAEVWGWSDMVAFIETSSIDEMPAAIAAAIAKEGN